jgi:hypothetical protein
MHLLGSDAPRSLMLLAMMSVLPVASAAWGQCEGSELDRLADPAGVPQESLGSAVGIDGDVAAVGVPGRDLDFANPAAGAAIVYRASGGDWSAEQVLLPADVLGGDLFGSSIAVSGERILIGSPFHDDAGDAAGAAYVYRFNGFSWSQQAKLLASDADPGATFGDAVDLDGDLAVVGAPFDEEIAPLAGAAYVYRFNGSVWEEEAKLTASDGAALDLFGNAVAIAGSTIIVGADGDDDAGDLSGAAYVFRFNGSTWEEQAKLTAADAEAGDRFGGAVDIDDDAIVIGARREDPCPKDPQCNSGSAYVFRFDGQSWNQQDKISADPPLNSLFFGTAVTIDGDFIVVGTPGDDIDGTDAGAAFAFGYDSDTKSWIELARLTPEVGSVGASFGTVVALSGHLAIIGAEGENDTRGAAYVFGGISDCNNNEALDICDILEGISDDADGDGLPDECVSLCPADLDGNDVVDVSDLLLLLAAWGQSGHPADLDGSGTVDVGDLLILLAEWGAC